MKRIVLAVGAAALVGGIGVSALTLGAAEPPAAPAQSAAAEMPAVIISSKDVKWGPAPPGLPPGSQLAVMFGDPAKAAFVSLRAKMPAGYKVPPHSHPTDEHVTVLSGALTLGMGDKEDAKTAKTYKAGGYLTARAKMNHYAIATVETVIQIDLIGPFDITYVNPADDPRNKGK